MDRPPRKLNEPLFGRKAVLVSLLEGLIILTSVLVVYGLALNSHTENAARALAFTTLVVCNLGLILTNRSQSQSILKTISTPSPTTWWVVGGTAVFLSLALFVPFFRDLFRFDKLHATDLILCLIAALASVAVLETLKWKPVRQILGIRK